MRYNIVITTECLGLRGTIKRTLANRQSIEYMELKDTIIDVMMSDEYRDKMFDKDFCIYELGDCLDSMIEYGNTTMSFERVCGYMSIDIEELC